MGNNEKVSLQIPEELLNEVDDKVVSGEYDNRSELMRGAIDEMLSAYNKSESDRSLILYDAAVSSLYKARREGKYDIEENAEEHILEYFPGSRMAKLLER